MKKLLSVLVLFALAFTMTGTAVARVTSTKPMQPHIQIRLHAVGGSGVEGIANLMQLPNNQGTRITVLAFGLQPDNTYVSLYYDNHVCNLEPYSVSDVIGGIYTANAGGVGATRGDADDNLPAINSVSVREAGTFMLLACGDVHPM